MVRRVHDVAPKLRGAQIRKLGGENRREVRRVLDRVATRRTRTRARCRPGQLIVVEAERAEESAVEIATEIVVAPCDDDAEIGRSAAVMSAGGPLQRAGRSHTGAIRDAAPAPASPGRAATLNGNAFT